MQNNENEREKDVNSQTNPNKIDRPLYNQRPIQTTQSAPNYRPGLILPVTTSQQRPQLTNPGFHYQTPNLDQTPSQPNTNVKIPWYKKLWSMAIKRWWLTLIVITLFITLTLSLYAYMLSLKKEIFVAYDKVTAMIQAPLTSPSGTSNSWKVKIENKEDVAITNVQVKINFPTTFKYITTTSAKELTSTTGDSYKLSKIEALGQGVIDFNGALIGDIDQISSISGEITYIPEPLIGKNDNTRTVSIPAANTTITASEIKLEVESDRAQVEKGGEINFIVTVKNQSKTTLSDLTLSAKYPDENNFTYLSSEFIYSKTASNKTKPDAGNNTWYISTISPLETQILKIKGLIKGVDNSENSFEFNVSNKDKDDKTTVLTSADKKIKTAPQALNIQSYLKNKSTDSSININETLNFVIDIENKNTYPIKDIKLTANISDTANILDWTKFKQVSQEDTPNINLDKSITWTQASSTKLTSLSPNQKVSIEFTIPTKEAASFLNTNLNQDKYYIQPNIKYTATDYKETVINGPIYKANGGLTFKQIVSYNPDPKDSNYRIYTIKWQLSTQQTSIKNIVIETTTPREADAFLNNSILPAEYTNKIQYDSASGRIKFIFDEIPAYHGVSKDPFYVSFQIRVKKESGSFRNILLLRDVTITGLDSYTQKTYSLTEKEYETRD